MEKCVFTIEKSIYPWKIQICIIENFEIFLYSELDSKRGFGDFVLNCPLLQEESLLQLALKMQSTLTSSQHV